MLSFLFKLKINSFWSFERFLDFLSQKLKIYQTKTKKRNDANFLSKNTQKF